MKISLTWIKDYVDIKLSPQELAHRLTMNGLNVEAILENDPFKGVVLGKVLEVTKHPNADKLSLTKVDVGTDILNIVCGAPNVKAGQLAPIATIGTMMPGNFEIKKAKIRGEESCGMICSKSELGFESGKSPGIWELDSTTPHTLGQSFAAFIGSGEVVLDIDVTSNRPDCLHMLGMAREIAMIENTTIRMPDVRVIESSEKAEAHASIAIEDREGCTRYAGRVIRNVTIGPSPDWLVKRLEAVGIRSINNIVDITNFVMLECGQPLHAFDYDHLAGHKIIVRKSRKGDTFQTLDDKSHTLNDETVMICDGEKMIAIGGIMGGKNSEISDSTKNVLLESAHFDGKRIRRSSKHLGIMSEASNRFGRGINPEGVIYAIQRAAQLMHELAGGEILAGVLDVNFSITKPAVITLRSASVTRLIGQEIPDNDIADILTRLGFGVINNGDGSFIVTAPSHRVDIEIEENLIDEVARIYGFDRIRPSTGAYGHYHHEPPSGEKMMHQTRAALREAGLSEVYTNAMVHPSSQMAVEPEGEKYFVRLMNPISEDMSVMRISMLPSLLEVVRGNLFRKNDSMQIYEIGRTYRNEGDPLPAERNVLAGCIVGQSAPTHWATKPRAVDYYDLKGIVDRIMGKFWLDSLQYNPYHSFVFAPNSVSISCLASDSQVLTLGRFGRIQNAVLRALDIDTTVWAFEIDYDVLRRIGKFRKTFDLISRFPFIRRDLALIVDEKMQAGVIQNAIRSKAGAHLTNLEVFDVYHGNQVTQGQKSLAFALRFESVERTLTEDEIDATMQSIIAYVENQFGAKLR